MSNCFEDSTMAAKFGIEKESTLSQVQCQLFFFVQAPAAPPPSSTRDVDICTSRKRAGQEISVQVEKKRKAYEKRERDLGYRF